MKTILEAIQAIKESSREKFNPTIEVHINLDLDIKKGQTLRYNLSLPKGTGKTKKVAVLASSKVESADLQINEDDINKILDSTIQPKVDFDIIVTEPKFMPKLAKVAKILGPLGLMPNPKTGTVTENVEEAVKKIKQGQVQIKTEKDVPIVHSIIGKKSFKDEDLMANFISLFNSVKQNKPQKTKPDWIKSVYICTTMGKSIQVDTKGI